MLKNIGASVAKQNGNEHKMTSAGSEGEKYQRRSQEKSFPYISTQSSVLLDYVVSVLFLRKCVILVILRDFDWYYCTRSSDSYSCRNHVRLRQQHEKNDAPTPKCKEFGEFKE